jgi:hypothetical protein
MASFGIQTTVEVGDEEGEEEVEDEEEDDRGNQMIMNWSNLNLSLR